MKIKIFLFIFASFFILNISKAQTKKKPIKTLIVDGQNNHNHWPKITYMMKKDLEKTGLFKVDVMRSAYTWGEDTLMIKEFTINGMPATEPNKKPIPDPNFAPDFSRYDLVIVNFGWNAAPWPDATNRRFESFVKKGGGVVIVHAADNSFPAWPAYNQMIGLGGWGDRTEKDGPYVYYNDKAELVIDNSPGKAGSHGPQHEYTIQIRDPEHPVTKGMPTNWLHAKDELYDKLRGPAQNMKILATAYSGKEQKGTGRHEPMLMAIDYGKGRIFHTPMGHADYSVECVGFITCLLRGSQWAATGKVSIPIPSDFPTETKTSSKAFVK
ncbi:MAG: ThuA domain-containing protein [Cytophagaceae bacterium]|nr:ThuA domain-containing protein [Cytophagaceae bacterium]MBK9935676.1 ThuA domain-containing protein [Cytophagaceae bacterium]MBL0302118.1 ThuA domain-containing protein [Cytophagaceae bacterium]MBL0324939.1 ThuA domain-containing protein [Cytophagaceae bacterium]